MRILLVEDNADHRELMSLALTGHDPAWQVEEVASGEQALRRLAEEEAYDLVFLDYSLPGWDGLGVLKRIRRGEAPPPVVMVTGLGDEQVAVEAMRGGAYDYVVKGEGYLQRLPVVAQRAVEAHQLAVKRKQAEEALERRAAQMALLNEIGGRIAAVLELDILLDGTSRLVQEGFGYHHVGLFTLDRERGELVMKARAGAFNAFFPPEHRIKLGQGVVGWVGSHGERLLANDVDAEPRYINFYPDVIPTRSELSVPIRVGGEVVGVLDAQSPLPNAFNESDVMVLETLADQLAVAIENARLVGGLETLVAARTAEIVAEKEKSEAILHSVGDAIAMVDLEMRIQYVNDAFTVLTGYTAEEALGQQISSVIGPGMSELDRQSMQLAQARGEPWHGEVTHRRKDGRTYDAALTTAPMREAEGRLAGYVSSHYDISRLKDLERARSRFITNVSHELRTPTANIKLYANLLRMAGRPERTGHYARVLEEQADRLTELIQDILEMTALDSGQGATVWKPVSLPTIITDAVTRYQSQAQASGLTLVAEPVPPDLPTVKGDQARLSQALGELVENAVIFTPAGGQVTVEARAVEEDWVTVAVRDTGPGISPEEQEQVFDRFYRGSLAESGHVPGTGLGLSIAQEIMRAHGGRVTVESKLGEGSTFTLRLRGAPS